MPARRRRTTTTTKRRTSSASGTASARRPVRRPAPRPPAPDLPAAGPGARVWVLAVPFRAPAPGASWHPGLQAHVFVGRALPPELAPYEAPPYGLERLLEDRLAREPRPVPPGRPLTPRPLQVEGAAAVVAHAAAGGRVFLLGDDPGVGKTGTAILAAREVARQRGGRAGAAAGRR